MNNPTIEQVVQQCYADFQSGNIPAFLDNLAEDIEWTNEGSPELSFSGTLRGKKEVSDFFSRLSEHSEYSKFEPIEFITNTNKVVVRGLSEGIVKFTGREFQSDWMMIWTVKDNKISKYQGLFDNSALVEAERPTKDNIVNIETAMRAMECYETGNIERAKNIYHENFRLTGPVPVPVNRTQYFELAEAIHKGIPDWCFNVSNVKVDGDKVKLSVEITGTQTGELALPIPGMKPIPPTGKKFKLPGEVLEITIRNDKIMEAKVENVPGGGIPGVVEQLGYSLSKF